MLNGCALGDRQSMADRVINAATRTERAGTARATVSIDAKVIHTKQPIAPGPPKISGGAASNLATVFDFGAHRVALGVPAGDLAHAAALFDGSRVFQRRDVKLSQQALAAAAGAPSNIVVLAVAANGAPPAAPAATTAPAPTTTTTAPPAPAGSAGETPVSGARLRRPTKVQRTWIGFDFAGLDKNGISKVAGSFAINPIDVLGLAKGALPGSMKLVGQETIGGASTTHFHMNVSRDKAERGVPDDTRKQLNKTFRANAIGGDVFAADAWVDGNGLLRQFTVRMRQSLSRTDRDDLTVTINLQEVGVPGAVPLPDPKETATVRDLGQLVHGTVAT